MKSNSLAFANPELALQWHPTENGDISPKDVSAGSGKKAWWLCEKGHATFSRIGDRKKSGCSECYKEKRKEIKWKGEKSLAVLCPELASEWHPTKNGEMTPWHVLPFGHEKAWWKCKKGHEWQTRVGDRGRKKYRCPKCSKKVASDEYNLETENPVLAKQWHPELNRNLTPRDVLPNSSKKVWWLCEKGHAYEAALSNRNTNKSACPFCVNQKAGYENSFEKNYPEEAKYWHPTKNGVLTPQNVTAKSGKKVWWLCEKDHETEKSVYGWIKYGCSGCSVKFASDDKNLESKKPDVAKQWHPTKNGTLTPKQVLPYSSKKVWWQCERKHEYEMKISDKSKMTQCPQCALPHGSSFPEQAVFFYLKKCFLDAKNKEKIKNAEGMFEIDISINSKKAAIEYDGARWHKNKEKEDLEKNEKLKELGYTVLRIREKPLAELSNCLNFSVPRNPSIIELRQLISVLIEKLEGNKPDYEILTAEDELLIRQKLSLLVKEKSVASVFPKVAKEWHPIKNGEVQPQNISYGSKREVWWKCRKGHEWKSPVLRRTSGKQNCPFCANKRVSEDNNLEKVNPKLAKEWHPTKNHDLTPSQVVSGSAKKAWWLCKRGHEWEREIDVRNNGAKCPYCRGFYASPETCLNTVNPMLAKEWSQHRNEKLTPFDVTAKSGKNVWWQCGNCRSEWQATVRSRNKGYNKCECQKTKRSRA